MFLINGLYQDIEIANYISLLEINGKTHLILTEVATPERIY